MPAAPAHTSARAGDAGSDAAINIIRTVTSRNPFGATDVRGNLVADGDFEFTGRQQQMPWIVFTATAQATLTFETGGKCRSGVRCGLAKQAQPVLGWFNSPTTGVVTVSMAIKPSTNRCNDVSLHIVNADNDLTSTAVRAPTAPDPDGYCTFSGTAAVLTDGSPALYVTVATNADAGITNTAILDNAVVLAMAPPSGGAHAPMPMIAQPVATSPELRARLGGMWSWLRANRIYGLQKDPPPDNPVRVRP